LITLFSTIEQEYDLENDEEEQEDDLTAEDDDDDDPDWDRYCTTENSNFSEFSGNGYLSTKSSMSLRNHECCSACHQTLPVQFCQTSSSYRKTEQQMKEFIYKMTLVDMEQMGCDKSSCRINGGKCVGLARIQDVNKLRKDFWGAQHDEAIKTKEKGQRLQEIMRKFYNGPKDRFEYKVGDVDVCEKGFFLLLGLINPSSQRIGEQLRRVMNTIRNIKQEKPLVDKEAMLYKSCKDPRNRCSQHAVK